MKKRNDNLRERFGYPSANRAMRMAKALAGEFEEITIDEKKSVLPKELLEKGIMNQCDFLRSRKDIEEEIEREIKSANRKNRSKEGRKCDLYIARHSKEDLKKFRIEYFKASDVEKFFRELLSKYELVEKDRIIRPRPQDTGKKHFVCEKCNEK